MADTMASREVQEREPFIDRMWLLQRGPLRRDTVLEYFGLSRFYDRHSNNEELRMQGHSDVRLEQLKDLKGVQFLAEQVPGVTPEQPIFVIWKIFRTSPRKTQVLEVYYVLNGFIYQAPTIISVLNAKLRRCAYMLNNAQTMLTECTAFDMGQQGQPYQFRRSEGESSSAPTPTLEGSSMAGAMGMVLGGGNEDHQPQPSSVYNHHHQQYLLQQQQQQPQPLESPASVERIIMSLVDDYLPKGTTNENGDSGGGGGGAPPKVSVYPGSSSMMMMGGTTAAGQHQQQQQTQTEPEASR